jgi:hypothetical protein
VLYLYVEVARSSGEGKLLRHSKSNTSHLTHNIISSSLFIPNWPNGPIANTSVTFMASVEYLLKSLQDQTGCNVLVTSFELG